MKNRADQLRALMLSFLASVVICWTGTGHAFESWDGEVTAEVNLRRIPGLDGKIFASLEKGDKVLVRDEHNDWFNVVAERETYGYIGWVYGRFIKRIDDKQAASGSPLAESTKKSVTAKELLKNDFGQAEQEPPQPFPQSQGYSLAASPPQGNLFQKGNVENRQTSTEGIPKTLQAETPTVASLTGIEKEETVFLEGSQKHNPFKESYPIVGKIESGKSAVSFNTEDTDIYKGIGILLRFLIRLSPIVLSCLALIFSYHAVRLAKGEEQLP
jgi:hypothetical protein